MSTAGQMYEAAHEELKRFLEEGNKRWYGYVSPIHLLMGAAAKMAKEDVESGWSDYWLETLTEYGRAHEEWLAARKKGKPEAANVSPLDENIAF